MLLTSLLALQLCFDVAVAALLVGLLLRRRTPAVPASPPDWHRESMSLVQDLVAATEPVLEALEGRSVAALPEPVAPAPVDRYRRALAQLRAGVDPDAIARGTNVLPAEWNLLRSIAASSTRRV